MGSDRAGAIAKENKDYYPTRLAQPGFMMERRDPVVYGEQRRESPLSNAQWLHYRDRGYLVLDDVFSADEVARLLVASDRLRTDPTLDVESGVICEPGSQAVRSVFQPDLRSELLAGLVRDPRLLAVARHLLGSEVYLYQSRLNYKPGFRGQPFYWHSDFETWHAEDGMPRMRALSMSITLTENRPENGPLMVMPGSHRQFVACQGETPEQNHRKSLKDQRVGVPSDACLSQLVAEHGIESLCAKPGSVIVFDCNTMHGSNSNITPAARSNLFLVYNAVDNAVVEPFCGRPPRPGYLCARTARPAPLQPGEIFSVR